MFKVKLGIAPLFMADIFEKRLIPNEGVVSGLRSQSYFYNYNNPRTTFIWLKQTSRRGFPQTVRADCVYLTNQV